MYEVLRAALTHGKHERDLSSLFGKNPGEFHIVLHLFSDLSLVFLNRSPGQRQGDWKCVSRPLRCVGHMALKALTERLAFLLTGPPLISVAITLGSWDRAKGPASTCLHRTSATPGSWMGGENSGILLWMAIQRKDLQN